MYTEGQSIATRVSTAHHKSSLTLPVKSLLAAAAILLAGCGAPQPSQPIDASRSPQAALVEPSPTVDTQMVMLQQLMKKGADIRSDADLKMLDSTHPGIDLTYSGNKRVDAIRAIPNPQERILAAIGFLAVEQSGRYNYDKYGVYDCNGYALDLARLLLGNEVIGSRYNRKTGQPVVAGINDINWGDPKAVRKFNEANPFLSSNDVDWWMNKYGKKFGWHQATTQAELVEALKNGAIAVGASAQEYIKEQRAQKPDQDYIGHAFVLGYVNGNFIDEESKNVTVGEMLIETQATVNTQLQRFPIDSPEAKADPKSGVYRFWYQMLSQSVTTR